MRPNLLGVIGARVAPARLGLTTSRIIAIALLVVAVGSSVAVLVLLALSATVPLPDVHGFRGATAIFGLTEGALGLAIAFRQPRNAVGWIFLVSGACAGSYELALMYSAYVYLVNPGLPGGEWAAWLSSWLWLPTTGLIPTFLFLLFPDGRLPSPRWRPVAWYAGIALAIFSGTVALLPGPLPGLPSVPNPLSPFSGQVTIGEVLLPLFTVLFVAVILCVAALVRRFRRSRGVERLQMKWIAYASGLYAVAVFLDSNFVYKPFEIIDLLVINAIPVAAGVAIFRYRLYDIDLLINRTLVYALTTAAIGAAFFGGIILLQSLLRPMTGGSEIAVAVSTLASFALFQPFRRRIQSSVDRRFYRARYDAGRMLDTFSGQLANEVDLDALRGDLLTIVSDAMQPVHASLWLRR
ncbi:MAG: hypothetical protein M3P16_12010 [Chloroflexota bacterium]|nr:hypothetical protein [Chloroflexota bacterium]